MKKILIIQRVPAFFRKPFFERLGEKCNLSVIAGKARENDDIKEFSTLSNAKFSETKIIYLMNGIFWFDVNWKKNIENYSPDTVVITPTPRMLSNYLLINYCKKNNIKIVGWGMGKMPMLGYVKSKLFPILLKTLVRRLDGIIAYSTTAKTYYNQAGVPNHKITVAYNSTDTKESFDLKDQMKDIDSVTSIINSKYGVKKNNKNIVFVGRLIRSKRVDELIKACDKFLPNTNLIIVGDGEHINDLKKLSRDVTANVYFTGHRNGADLAEIMLASDLFVLPSLGGLAIHQAMSYGLPVVVSEGDGTEADLIKDGVNGYIFKSNDFEDMVIKINTLLKSDDLAKMGGASLSMINEKFNIENMVSNFESRI
ncbi:glycosyltransferase [Vibrio mediterranei]|uniref:glycosyltransferase n=1 Tax=Vibrio mediterranei TaxID=689 RepID=UPI001EFE1881|nr:glycosyltransferase [Vibrio mediterranei]MCG9666044.1 glycosyltransferase [Vibrio mediterranei]